MTTIKGLREIEPYVAGSQPSGENLIKLNTNENAYGPSPKVAEVFSQFDVHQLRKYSTLDQKSLRIALAKQHGLEPDQIIVGNGSDDILSMAFLAFFNSDDPVLFPDLTYGFYKVWADLYRIPYETPALDENMAIRSLDYKRENGGIIFPNPNAPTGLYMPLDQVEEIVRANQDVIVIVDEAYIDFAGPSARELLPGYDNLLVVQTFSKSRQLAGARLGLAMGNAKLIADLNRVKFSLNPYNINRLTLKAGKAALEDTDYFDKTRAAIVETRGWTKQQLEARGFAVLDSRSNFLFASTDKKSGGELYRKLKEKGVLVRHFDAPRISNWLRITIGTPDDMTALLRALDEILEG